jgi:microcystin-dependent protein
VTVDPGATSDPTTPDAAPAVADPTATSAGSDSTITALADAITDTSGSTGPDTRPSDGAVLRYGKVTAIGTGATAGSVQTDATGAAWVLYDAGYAPALNDLVYLLQQGPVSHVGGKLGGTQPTPPPIGVMHPYAGAAAPTGWLVCDGSTVSRTTYAQLFAVCGTTYGSGDGSTTFGLPNTVDRIPVGSGVKFIRGEVGGSETFTLTTAQLPSHTHGSGGSHDHTGQSHDHTGSSMGTHDHPGSSHTHTVNHDHVNDAHSHSLGVGTSPSKAVTGGSAAFTSPSYSATSGSTTNNTQTYSGSSGSTTVNVAAASAGTPNIAAATAGVNATDPGPTAATGSGSSVNNMPPYLSIGIWIIRALP